MNNNDLYLRAQLAITELKACVRSLLLDAGKHGLTNAEIGRALGIYGGHSSGQEGHISRTLLEILEAEGVANQDESKRWHIGPRTSKAKQTDLEEP